MQRQPSTQKRPASRTSGSLGSSGLRLGWVVGVFLSCLALVVCVIVAAAWMLGGRAAHTAPTVQELLPPQPVHDSAEDTEAATVSGLQPPVGAADSFTVGETAAILPGARDTSRVKEIPVESISALKSMGWTVPYLSRRGYEHQYAETALLNGVRTVQTRLSDGDHYINVAETRPEAAEAELQPLGEKLHTMVNLDAVASETLPLSTGQEASLYRADDDTLWTAAVENDAAHYVITSDLPVDAAGEISSWVLITDRSRVQMLPASPDASDRLERGMDELLSLFDCS